MRPRWPLAFTVATLILTTSACAPDTPEAVFDDYYQRTIRTLELEADSVPSTPAAPLAFPQRRDRLLPTTELRSGLLDVLEFQECGLLPLIAERNSGLGRVMTTSGLMGYELRFFRLLHACYYDQQQHPTGSRGFHQRLEEAYRIKRQNLPAVIWNGIFTDEALEANFSLSRRPIPLEGHPGFTASLEALNQLQRYPATLEHLQTEGRFDLLASQKEIEQQLFALYRNEYGSQLISAKALATRQLERTAEAIESALALRPVCYLGRPSEKGNILRNVFTRYYIERVQPYVSRLNRESQAWYAALNGLLAEFPSLPPAMHAYQARMLSTEPDSLNGRFGAAIKRHTQAWRSLFTQCGLMPGSPVPE